MSTRELLGRYFESKPEEARRKIRAQLDREELYNYEKQSGKSILEWDSSDVINFLILCNAGSRKLSIRSIDVILSLLRMFYEWYNENIGEVKNPCNDKKLKGKRVSEIVFNETREEPFTRSMLEDVCAKLHQEEIVEFADYLECIVRMAYEGFGDTQDMIALKPEDIDHETHIVTIRQTKHKLSDRLYKLLVRIHEMEIMPGYRGNFVMVSCEGSYFKFLTREKNADKEHDITFYMNYLSRLYIRKIKPLFDIDISLRGIYVTGFYDYLCEKYGKDYVEDSLNGVHVKRQSDFIMLEAAQYGIRVSNMSQFKQTLKSRK